jgi:RNA polymerase sigma-70 factor (ECF subfamily)
MKVLKNLKDKEIIKMTQKGSIQAFEELYRRYYKKLYFHVYEILEDREKSLDLTQDIFIRVYKKINLYKFTDKKFITWLYRVATNETLRKIKKEKKERDKINKIMLNRTPYYKKFEDSIITKVDMKMYSKFDENDKIILDSRIKGYNYEDIYKDNKLTHRALKKTRDKLRRFLSR